MISVSLACWEGSGQSMVQRMQACSWMQGVPNERAQVPRETLRRSKCPRNSVHSSSVGLRYSSLGAVRAVGQGRRGENLHPGLHPAAPS